MEIHQVRYFLALFEEQSFTRAAKRCGVSQPSLSDAIRRLERKLGRPLFVREGRRVQLTELGRCVLPHLTSVERSVDAAKHAAARFSKRKAAAQLPLDLLASGPTS